MDLKYVLMVVVVVTTLHNVHIKHKISQQLQTNQSWNLRSNEMDDDYLPFVCTRWQLAVISVVNVKYGIHRSSILTSPNVSRIVLLNSRPENMDVMG